MRTKHPSEPLAPLDPVLLPLPQTPEPVGMGRKKKVGSILEQIQDVYCTDPEENSRASGND